MNYISNWTWKTKYSRYRLIAPSLAQHNISFEYTHNTYGHSFVYSTAPAAQHRMCVTFYFYFFTHTRAFLKRARTEHICIWVLLYINICTRGLDNVYIIHTHIHIHTYTYMIEYNAWYVLNVLARDG